MLTDKYKNTVVQLAEVTTGSQVHVAKMHLFLISPTSESLMVQSAILFQHITNLSQSAGETELEMTSLLNFYKINANVM